MAEELPIDDGIPIPPIRGGEIRPWRKIQVGQSFECKTIGDKQRLQHTLTRTAKWMKDQYGLEFTTRQTEKGVRVWRIK